MCLQCLKTCLCLPISFSYLAKKSALSLWSYSLCFHTTATVCYYLSALSLVYTHRDFTFWLLWIVSTGEDWVFFWPTQRMSLYVCELLLKKRRKLAYYIDKMLNIPKRAEIILEMIYIFFAVKWDNIHKDR